MANAKLLRRSQQITSSPVAFDRVYGANIRGVTAVHFLAPLCWVKGRLKAGSDGLFCICVESNTVIQNQIFISYANNPGIPFPVVQFESLGSKTMVSVVPNPPVHVC